MAYEISNFTLLYVIPIISYKSVIDAPLLRHPLIPVFAPVPRKQRLVILSLTIPTVDKDRQLKFPTSGDFPVFQRTHSLLLLILTNKTCH